MTLPKRGRLDLRPGEHLLKTGTAALLGHFLPPVGSLKLTNQRLVWKRGWLPSAGPAHVQIELTEIVNCAEREPGLVVEASLEQYAFLIGGWPAPLVVYLFGRRNLREWLAAIEQASAARRSA